MAKWVYFFIGLLIASILAVTVFLGMSSITIRNIKDIITYLFIGIFVLLVVLAIIALTKDKILEHFNLKVAVGAEEVVDVISRTIGDAVNGNRAATQQNSKDLATVAGEQTVAIENQTSLIKEQKVVLENQNTIIEKQKDIQMLSIANQLRQPFLVEKKL